MFELVHSVMHYYQKPHQPEQNLKRQKIFSRRLDVIPLNWRGISLLLDRPETPGTRQFYLLVGQAHDKEVPYIIDPNQVFKPLNFIKSSS